MRDNTDTGKVLGDYALSPSGLSRCASQSKTTAAIASGPSESFIRRSRNPDLEPPARFTRTVKAEGDIVL